MIKAEEIHPGLILRVISSHGLGAPVGSLATVKTIETSRSGDWMAVIEYHDARSRHKGHGCFGRICGPQTLGRFEIVRDVQRTVAKQVSKAEAMREARRAQLRLPFSDELNTAPSKTKIAAPSQYRRTAASPKPLASGPTGYALDVHTSFRERLPRCDLRSSSRCCQDIPPHEAS